MAGSSSQVAAQPPLLLAIGMNAAPFNHPKRRQVRNTMLQHGSVRSGRIVFRFVVGTELVNKTRRTSSRAAASAQRWSANQAALHQEAAAHGDIALVDAIDGPGVAMECPAAEKTIQWLKYALRTWPHAQHYRTTEDDTFVHLDMLALELDRLAMLRQPNLIYGLFGICSMPGAARAERSATGFKACFLGTLERVGWITGAYRSVVQWRAGGAGGAAGGGGGGMQRKCAPGSTEPAPFPTGPLAVFGADLAAAVFGRCAYLDHFLQRGRLANRRTLCRGKDKVRSWASLVGDCAIGHWVSRCARGRNVTIAHMTYTKAHHYAVDAGGQGWVAPSNHSIAVHWLKKHTGPSGPTRTEGGEWDHAVRAAAGANGPGFPPLLWRYRPDRVLRSGRLLDEALNARVHEYYARACGVWHVPVMTHVNTLRARLANCGQGGNPLSWPFYGCHPSRGYLHPIWPPRPGVMEASDASLAAGAASAGGGGLTLTLTRPGGTSVSVPLVAAAQPNPPEQLVQSDEFCRSALGN